MLIDVADFDEFAEMVKQLRKEIQQARSETPAAKAPESQQVTKEKTEQVTKGKTEDKTGTVGQPEKKSN